MRKLGIVVALGILVGCWSVFVLGDEPQFGGTLRAAMQTNPPTLDPHIRLRLRQLSRSLVMSLNPSSPLTETLPLSRYS